MILALLVFLGSGVAVFAIRRTYKASRQSYADAASAYTQKTDIDGNITTSNMDEAEDNSAASDIDDAGRPPIIVDFERLQGDNPQVVAWLYCPGTAIDYPVIQGVDNEFYLHHSYTGAEDQSGAIFVDSQCSPGFTDSNSIIYGHSMKDGSMFGGLEAWEDQDYFDSHPVIWLLTPQENYKVRLFSGYTTSAYSNTYTIFRGPGSDFSAYLAECLAQSDFITEDRPSDDSRCVVLSTCAYDFDEARYVLHGRLEQVGTQ